MLVVERDEAERERAALERLLGEAHATIETQAATLLRVARASAAIKVSEGTSAYVLVDRRSIDALREVLG